jgi:hypothetical protein
MMDMHARALAAVQDDLEMARATPHDALKALRRPRPIAEGEGCWRDCGQRCGGGDLDTLDWARMGRTGLAMTTPPETALVHELRARIHELERQNTDLRRQVTELRAAVAALMEPAPRAASGAGCRAGCPLNCPIACRKILHFISPKARPKPRTPARRPAKSLFSLARNNIAF